MTKWLLVVLSLAACDRSDPAPVAAAASTTAPSIPYGRWTSDTHCLVLLENGDFELIDKAHWTHGKTVVYGTAKQIPYDDGIYFDLAVDGIWQARWVSPCRKQVSTAKNLREFKTIDVTWRPALHQKVRITASDDGQQIELCIDKTCLALHKDDEAPLVDAHWKIPNDAVANLPADAPGHINIRSQETSLTFRPANPNTSWPSVYAKTKAIEVLGHDRFRVTIVVSWSSDNKRLSLWGTPLVEDTQIVLALHRLAGERLEACVDKQCAIYTRNWDSDSEIR